MHTLKVKLLTQFSNETGKDMGVVYWWPVHSASGPAESEDIAMFWVPLM